MVLSTQTMGRCALAASMLCLLSVHTVRGQNGNQDHRVIGVTPESSNVPQQPAPLNPQPPIDIHPESIPAPVPVQPPSVPTLEPPAPASASDANAQSIPSLLDSSDEHRRSHPLEENVITDEQLNSMLSEPPNQTRGRSDFGYSVLESEPATQHPPRYSATPTYCPEIIDITPHRCWVRAEVLGLWLEDDRVPALVTTSPNGTAQADAGQLGLATTTTVFGDGKLEHDLELGGRIGFGRWLDNADTVAVAGEFTYMRDAEESRLFASTGNPIIARPIFNLNPGVLGQDADLIAFGGLLAGQLLIDSRAELYSGNFGMRVLNLSWTDPCKGRRAEFITGMRYMRLEESLTMADRRTALAAVATLHGNLALGTTFDSLDRFTTENDFYGFDIGTDLTWQRGRWSWNMLTKVGIGVNHQVIEADGRRILTPAAGAATTLTGGLLTGTGNMGQFARHRFAVLPEVRMAMGCDITKNLKTTIGYQFMMLSDVVRPGAQVDTAVNGTLLDPAVADAGTVGPSVLFNSNTMYMHGATASLEFRY